MIRLLSHILLLLLLTSRLGAQTGIMEIDFREPIPLDAATPDSSILSPAPKSLWIAGGLSAILPGAGQIYTEAPLWRTLLYGVVEATGWTVYAVSANQGSEATLAFESYAESQWSVERYVDWIGANLDRWQLDAADAAEAHAALQRVYRSGDRSVPVWERIDLSELNRLERAIPAFSHTLQSHGEQQYYEMIGKYAQFRAGWIDHVAQGDTLIYDPARTSVNNRHYMEMRATANDYLGTAVLAGGVVMLNHLASMLDAVLSARSYNISISTQLRGDILTFPNDDILLATQPHLQVVVRY